MKTSIPDRPFEDEVRVMLQRRACDVEERQVRHVSPATAMTTDHRPPSAPLPVEPTERQGRRASFIVAAAAAAVIVVGAAVAVIALRLPGTDHEQVSTPLAQSGTSSGRAPQAAPSVLPRGFNPATAVPVFQSAGDAPAVARAYLAQRIPDMHAELTAAPSVGAVRVFRWRSHTDATDNDHLPQGTIQLRQVKDAWSVVAATTDELRFEHVSLTGGQLDLTVAPTSRRPADTTYLTTVEPSDRAATGALGSISVHSPVRVQGLGDGSVRVLMQLVGGTVLSTTEFSLAPGIGAGTSAATAGGGTGAATRWATSPGHGPLPAGFDLQTAAPVYVGSGSASSVAGAYLRDRLPDVTVDLDSPTTSRGIVEIAWKVHAPNGDAGWVWLRRAGSRWAVVAAGTDGVDTARTEEPEPPAGYQASTGDVQTQVMGVVETAAGYGRLDVALTNPHERPSTAFARGLVLDGSGSFYGLVLITDARGETSTEPLLLRLQHEVGGRHTSITELHLTPGLTGRSSCTPRADIRLTCAATSPPTSASASLTTAATTADTGTTSITSTTTAG